MVYRYDEWNSWYKIKKLKKSALLQYFPQSKYFLELSDALKASKSKIQLKGNVGSAKAILAASLIREQTQPQLFILNDKEQANYFINDLEIFILVFIRKHLNVVIIYILF